TIEQSRLSGATDWGEGYFYHANVGYLRGSTPLNVSTVEQEGSWFDIGMGSKERLKQKVFKLWIDHGVKPRDASYAYTVLPATTLDATKSAARNAPVTILSNTPALQAARHHASAAVACVFVEAGKLDAEQTHIAVDQPCLLLLHDGNVTVSNPENKK